MQEMILIHKERMGQMKDYTWYLKRLEKPKGIVDVVIDTDAFNEIDDQFAIVYALKSTERLNVKAIFAAPFLNKNSISPEDGMLKSYDEIVKILSIMKKDELIGNTYKGSSDFLKNETSPIESDAAIKLVELARKQDSENPLYVISIGAITNIASAILMDNTIIDKIVVVWLGGHSHSWHDNKEFNLRQDIAAARIIFGSGVPLIQLPCQGVVSEFLTTAPELEYWFKGKNDISDFLFHATVAEGTKYEKVETWSRTIWDVTAVAWLIDGDFMYDRILPSPIPEYDHHYAFDYGRHPMKYVYGIKRDNLMQSLVDKITR